VPAELVRVEVPDGADHALRESGREDEETTLVESKTLEQGKTGNEDQRVQIRPAEVIRNSPILELSFQRSNVDN
jgi:hypothetical protein